MSGTTSWRRTRPFWGGLLTLLAGLELLSIPFAVKALPLVIQSGAVGATYLVALLLIIVGLLIWLQPGQRVFFGVVAVLLSIASFVYANLGGFLAGMLLGLVGGALAAAWAPLGEDGGGGDGDAAAPGGFAPGGMTFTDRRVVSGEERLDAAAREAARQAARQAEPAMPPGGTPRVIIGRVRGGGTAPPEKGGTEPGDGLREEPDRPGEKAERPGGRSGEQPEDTAEWSGEHAGEGTGDGTGRGRHEGPGTGGRALAIAVMPVLLLPMLSLPGTAARGDAAARPAAAPDPVPATGEPLLPGVLPTPLPDVPGVLNGLGGLVGATPVPTSPGGHGGSSPTPGQDDAPSSATGGGALPMVATEPAAVRAPSLTMTGMKFRGVVRMPTATGSVKMLWFTMDKAVLAEPRQTMGATTLTGRTFTFEGDVVIYTTRMTGSLLGLPQDFTADNPNVLVRALKLVPSLSVPLTMTDIVSEQPYVRADSLRADGLHLVVGS
ncbi:hypothetical protein JOL79_19665 [Microbispora sp. RL4-1S]|uniref:Uncharacterized protein n=1 Tax=Microbispora oryzae TaxID=2806554 RepID=A0A941AJ81_9ACTN|nr:DUF6114 domain-containing protein [Microbispora oryzae]MBP2706030.1 hypothetical protein [Microbispora oryzae]